MLLLPLKMRRDHQRGRDGHLLARRDVQELVRPMRIRMRPQHAGDHELRVGKLVPQHAHERDRAAFAHVGDRLAKRFLRGVVHRRLQPRRQRRRVPAALAAFAGVELDSGAIGRVRLQRLLDRLHGLFRVERRRRAHADLGLGVGQQHVAGIDRLGIARHADRRELRPPGAVQHHLAEIVDHRLRRAGKGELAIDLVAQHARRFRGLGDALRRDLHEQLRQLHLAGRLVLQPREQRARDAEGGGHDPRRVARMHALVQHGHLQRAGRDAAQRRGEPHPVPVAAAGIEADHQRRIADPVEQVVDIEGQVVAAGFLAALDHDDAAGARDALLLESQERREAGIDRIAVVGAATAIELVVLAHRDPRPHALRPALHLGLLVEMAVEQDGVVVVVPRDLYEDQRRAPRQPHHLHRRAREGGDVRARPVGHQRDRLLHVAILLPLRVEGRRLVGDADVLGERRQDLVVPEAADEGLELVGVHGRSLP